jgi:hypothetical protein
MVEEWHANLIALWLDKYPTGLLLPCTLPTGFEAASRAFGPDPQEHPMQESVFGRRFVRLMGEEFRKTLVSKFHDHKYVFRKFNDRIKFYASFATIVTPR